jgi:hypothetical protein
MANRHAGEADIVAGGKTYTLVFDINSLCEVEYILDKSTDQILRSLVTVPPVHVVRALLWGGLRTHHPEMDLIAAGRIIEQIGGVGPALDMLGEAMKASFPEPEDAKGPKSPRKGAKVGTGPRS